MRWILDDGPFDTLANLVEPSNLGAYPAGRLLVAPATARASQRSAARARFLDSDNPEDPPVIEAFDLLIGSDDPAAAIFLELHGEEATATDQAERESIAWALVHGDDAVFVLEDKRAALTALAELGRSRVAHSLDLWIELLEEGAITPDAFQRLCERTKGRDNGLNRMPMRVVDRFPQE